MLELHGVVFFRAVPISMTGRNVARSINIEILLIAVIIGLAFASSSPHFGGKNKVCSPFQPTPKLRYIVILKGTKKFLGSPIKGRVK